MGRGLPKQAEEALQAERDRAQQYLDIAGVIMVSIAPDLTITLINRKGCELLGYAREELIGKNWFDTVLPEDESEKVKAVFARLMEGELELAEYVENHVRTRGGEKRLISWHNIMVRDEAGSIIGTLSSGEDITERRQAEERLKNSEEKFRALYENAPVLIDAFDNNGRCIMWNNECEKVFGWTIDEINAHAEPLALFYPDPDIRREVIDSVTSQPGNLFREWHPMTKDRNELTVLWANFHIPNGMVINIGHDITERRQAEERLIGLNAYNRGLIEASIDPLVTIDHVGKISDVNAATEQMTGVPRQDLIGSDFSDYFTEPEKAKEGYQRVFKDGLVRDYPLELRHKDGHVSEVMYNASVYRDKNGRVSGVFAAARDITDRKRLEEEQQKVAKLESIGLLAAGIAHNFNNILTVILGSIDIVKMDANPGSENHEVLEQAEKASLRARDLTAQLLTFAKGGVPVKKITSMAELIKDTIDSALSGSNVKCHFSISADLRQAEIDVVQVRQVIYNLVTNARQAMPAGGTIELLAENITIGTTNGADKESMLEAGDYIMISLTDHGSGIPEKNMGKIFDPFFTTRIGAVGLGLATSFSIVRRHGGHIRLASKDGDGSTVYVYLPVAGKSS
jgi:two-component system, cell cycle sensor histidine kinase and response regulator CckA